MRAEDADIEDLFKVLPKHVCMSIEHNPHAGVYRTAEDWLRDRDNEYEVGWITADDRLQIVQSGEIWTISWCPDTPVGSCFVAAATLHRALELAGD
jgi:hypothetical protein